MGQANAYFQFVIKEHATYIKLFPAALEGNVIEIGELTEYLERHGCPDYNLKELVAAINSNEMTEIMVGDIYPIQINEEMSVTVSADAMEAVCRFYPAAGGTNMNVQEILRDLTAKGVKAGVDQDEILKFFQDRAYCTDFVLAKGKKPVDGQDARIEYYFNTDVDLKPKKNEDGSVDYRELNVISHINEGDLLAKLFPEDRGIKGYDVQGREIKPKQVRSLQLEYGNNIRVSEDKTELYSEVTGHASLVNGKVFVSDVYEVPADVDNSTGNIDYPGNVTVRGNVKGGFSIIAKGDIVVEGVVEDALIQAGGQIIVKRGIHGMTKGILRAQGNVICKFIENATIISGGYVETDSILHSKVSAATEVRVSGKNGFITGGVIRAGSLVEAQTIGSSLGAGTRIEVGVDPEKKERYVKVQEELLQLNKTIEQIRTILTTYGEKLKNKEKLDQGKIQYIEQLMRAFKEKEAQRTPLKHEYERLQSILNGSSNARVKVSKTLYAGVIVNITDVSLIVKDDRSFCQLYKDEGEVKISNM